MLLLCFQIWSMILWKVASFAVFNYVVFPLLSTLNFYLVGPGPLKAGVLGILCQGRHGAEW